MQLSVNLPGYERINVYLNEAGEIESYQLCCTSMTLKIFKNCIHLHGKKIGAWPLPNKAGWVTGNISSDERRSQLLIQELILKSRQEWLLPYTQEIVCTCRGVSSETINDAITAKASTVEEISNWTTACTSCTTCKDKIEQILQFRHLLASNPSKADSDPS